MAGLPAGTGSSAPKPMTRGWVKVGQRLGKKRHYETKKAFGVFRIYRDPGPTRTLQKASIELAKNESFFRRQVAKYSWTKRAEAYDP
jgi:hypothetical protein